MKIRCGIMFKQEKITIIIVVYKLLYIDVKTVDLKFKLTTTKKTIKMKKR